jgi:hypothetical protein
VFAASGAWLQAKPKSCTPARPESLGVAGCHTRMRRAPVGGQKDLMIEVEQTLDRGIDARQIGELKLRAEQQLQSDPVDRLHPELGAQAFKKRIAFDSGRHAGFDLAHPDR